MHRTIKVGDLIKDKKAHSQTGPFGTQLKASEYVHTGIPVINVRNIGMGSIRENDLEFVTEEKALELKSHSLQENDIVFGRKGAVERHALITKTEQGWIQGSDCIRLRILTDEINPKFVSYFFRTKRHQQWMINLGSFGATMGSLNQEIISKIEIPNFSLTLQKKIASTLSTYDDLIENNNKRIQLLEEMAAEIYKEWFVRLRFTGYQKSKFFDKDGKEVAHGTEGSLPEGWEKTTLGKACDIEMGQSPKSEFYNKKMIGLPFHQGVTNFNNRFPTHKMYCSDLKKIAEESDILLSVRAPVGRINIANDRLILGRGLCGIKHKNKRQNYLFYLLKDIFKHEDSFGNGAVFNAVSKTDLEKIKFNKSQDIIESEFQKIVEPIDKNIAVLTQKNQILQETRDLLLPRLISGKLSVDKIKVKPTLVTT